jgi:hypothetical protein
MCLWLVKNGVPYETAFNLDDRDLLAHVIVMGGFEGNSWDWNSMDWEPPTT